MSSSDRVPDPEVPAKPRREKGRDMRVPPFGRREVGGVRRDGVSAPQALAAAGRLWRTGQPLPDRAVAAQRAGEHVGVADGDRTGEDRVRFLSRRKLPDDRARSDLRPTFNSDLH